MTATSSSIPTSDPTLRVPASLLRGTPGRIRLALSSMAPTLTRVHAARHALRILVLLTGDAVALLLAWGVVHRIFQWAAIPFPEQAGMQRVISGVVALALLGCYGSGDLRRNPGALGRASALGTMLALWGAFWNQPFLPVALSLLAVTVATAGLLVLVRRSLDRMAGLVRPHGSGVVRAVVVGAADGAARLIEHPVLGETPWCHLVDFLEPDASPDITTRKLAELVHAHRVDTVIVAGRLNTRTFAAVLDAAMTAGCQVLSLPRVPPTSLAVPRMVWRNGYPVMELTRPALHGARLVVKRLIDLALAATALLLLAPLLAAIALLVRRSSPGPLLFRQTRIGQGGKPFIILKFRTMLAGSESQRDALQAESLYADPRLFKLARDPRVTAVGAVLRRTSLDELPQLWNVLRGDMALVGPRPPLPGEVSLYEAKHYARFDVKPGMTGPWQVGGRSTIHDFEEVVRLETAYIRRWNLWADLELLLRTVPAVFRGRGAY